MSERDRSITRITAVAAAADGAGFGSSGYDEDFKVHVVDRFNAYFADHPVLTAAARSAAEECGVSVTTVHKWAEEQGRKPIPTWGEIRRLRAENDNLRERVAMLEGQLSRADWPQENATKG
ncbi:helix-turn-helix transcriptional regulator [Corynebacterium sp.]|uniref:helix-turn-helix domain-containing protein n=1 Tax=Corynebacterium sp. TaxID=1720 RepID=UPI0028B073B3|nr:helix-turn-helix transcriptional regulator [Corynebacterium sp.]